MIEKSKEEVKPLHPLEEEYYRASIKQLSFAKYAFIISVISLYLTLTDSKPIGWLFDTNVVAYKENSHLYFPWFYENVLNCLKWMFGIGLFVLMLCVINYVIHRERELQRGWLWISIVIYVFPFFILGSFILLLSKTYTMTELFIVGMALLLHYLFLKVLLRVTFNYLRDWWRGHIAP